MSTTTQHHPSLQGKEVPVTGAASGLQDPADAANAIHSMPELPPATVVAELTVLPLRETCWP